MDNYVNLPLSGGGGGGAGVSSWNGRTGIVVPQINDYLAYQIGNIPAGTISATDVQTALNQLDSSKQPTITGAASTITTANLATNLAVISTAAGKIGVSSTTAAELGYLSGVTSGVQAQLDGKQPLSANLTALAGIALTGLLVRTGAGTAAVRTIAAGSSKISVLNGDGVADSPSIDAVEANFNKNALGGGALAPANGGTGATSIPTNGQIPIGDGSVYTPATLTAGTGISVINAAGSVTIVNSAVAAFVNIDGGNASTVFTPGMVIDGGNA